MVILCYYDVFANMIRVENVSITSILAISSFESKGKRPTFIKIQSILSKMPKKKGKLIKF
jgi:hypothetical protein